MFVLSLYVYTCALTILSVLYYCFIISQTILAGKRKFVTISGPLRMYLAPLENGAHVPVKIVADTDKVGKVTLTAKTLRFEPLVTTAAAGTTGKGGGR